ncbi:MAG: T9SS type A sorting domain-containing protein [Chitinophagales bacterium]
MKSCFTFLLFLLMSNLIVAQSDCEKFEIVSIYDFPATPNLPGGNFILLLLTVSSDLNGSFDPYYSSLHFADENGTPITEILGGGYTLPKYTTDTIPYVMELASEDSNQDFPNNFTGSLVIHTLNVSPNPTDCDVSYTNIVSHTNEVKQYMPNGICYPNPFQETITVEGTTIKTVLVYDNFGCLINQQTKKNAKLNLDLSHLPSGFYYLQMRTNTGKSTFKTIIKH